MTDTQSPKAAGYKMPAEWSPHVRTWMMWPCRKNMWHDIEDTRRRYADVAHAIRQFEPLTMVTRAEDQDAARNLLGSDIDFLTHPIDDSWARDAGPCFVKNNSGQIAGVSFEFNAWGNQYEGYAGDNSVAKAILHSATAPVFSSPLIAEGGGISVDGAGTILTTESCFPNANRNPDWTKQEIEQELMEMLGGERVIWLPGNVEETETDGHVDGIAVFAARGKVIMQDTGPRNHPWYHIHKANIEALKDQTDAQGRAFEIIFLPDASDAQPKDGGEICDSYVNFYLCNGGVIMPKYGLREDDLVREQLQDAFPDRQICQVDIGSIATGGGGIHCITQQQPA